MSDTATGSGATGSPPAAPAGRRGRLFADRAGFGTDLLNTFLGRNLAALVGLVRTAIVPTLLGPSAYGVWRLLSVVDSFSRFTHLGTVSALTRQVPYYEGSGKKEEAVRARSTALGMTWLGGGLTAAGLLAAAFLVDDPALRLPLALFAGFNLVSRFVLYYQTLFKAERLFGSEARIRILNAVLATPLVLAAVWWFGLAGLVAGSAVTALIVVGLYRRRFGLSLRPAIDRVEFGASVRVGLPILLTGVLGLSVRSTDKIMIGALLGVADVGLFALGATVADRLGQLAWMVGSVMMPRLAGRFGEKGDVAALRDMVERAATFAGLVFPGLALLALPAADALYGNIWSSFVAGEPALRLQVLTIMFVAIYMSYAGFFAAIRKQMAVVWMQVAVLVLNVAGNWLLIRAGWGILGAAISTGTCLVLFSVAQTSFALAQFGGARVVARGLARVYTGPLLALFLALASHLTARRWLAPDAGWEARAGVDAAAALVYLAVALWRAGRLGMGPSVVLAHLRDRPR